MVVDVLNFFRLIFIAATASLSSNCHCFSRCFFSSLDTCVSEPYRAMPCDSFVRHLSCKNKKRFSIAVLWNTFFSNCLKDHLMKKVMKKKLFFLLYMGFFIKFLFPFLFAILICAISRLIEMHLLFHKQQTPIFTVTAVALGGVPPYSKQGITPLLFCSWLCHNIACFTVYHQWECADDVDNIDLWFQG